MKTQTIIQRIRIGIEGNSGSISKYLWNICVRLGLTNILPDKLFLKIAFRIKMGEKLDLKNPVSFNEKIQWLKLYDRRPEYSIMADKYDVKQYVADRIGEEYIIPTLGVWDRFEDIDFDQLPNQFVLKCTHDSGGIVICEDKSKLDREEAKRKLSKALKQNYYWLGREWCYKNIKPRIIAEKYIIALDGTQMNDYKLMCFNGKVKCTFICTSRFSEKGLHVTFYDTQWNKMPFERHYPAETEPCPKPKSYAEMARIAEALSKDLPFARIDLYDEEGKLYFGEITFYPGNGMEEFTPKEWGYTLGSYLKLPEIKIR